MGNDKGEVPVTERAVLRRVNRALAKQGQQMKKKRDNPQGRWRRNGDYFILNLNRNTIVVEYADPEAWARDELEVLAPYETVAEP